MTKNLLLADANVWIAAAIYSRMVTGGARTYADWLFIKEAAPGPEVDAKPREGLSE